MVGAALPVAAIGLFGNQLPVPATPGLYPLPLLLAATYGLLTAASFALWPLGRAAQHTGRGPVPRRRAARGRRRPARARRQPPARPAARRQRGGHIGRSDVRAAVLPGRAGDAGGVPCRRLGPDGCSPALAHTAPGLAASGPGQPAPAGFGDAAAARLARARPDDAGRGGADRGQHQRASSPACWPSGRRASSSSISRTTRWTASVGWSRPSPAPPTCIWCRACVPGSCR